MSTAGTTATPHDVIRRPGGFVVLLVVTFLALTNYAALLSVVPLWAAEGGAGSAAMGGTTGVMMAGTVAAQLAMPWLFRLLDLRAMVVVGAALLGAPTPFYLLTPDLLPVLALSAARGAGFALVVVAGGTLVAELSAAGRFARSAALYGTSAALPNLVALPGGVWVAGTWGFDVTFWFAGAASLAGALIALGLPGRDRGSFTLRSLAAARHIVRPIGIFLLAAASFGAATTFIPVAGPGTRDVALALLIASVALVAARLAAGAAGDRIGTGRLLLPAGLTCAAGVALVAVSLAGGPWFLLGAFLLGAGFGATQNDSFVSVMRALGTGHHGAASTIWNIAYDGGLGAGAFTLGLVIAGAGYSGAFLALAAAIAVVTLGLGRVTNATDSRPPPLG
ncbi:MFS transporter [Myceligenerans pegani]|uniref:MFS transporter n=1 Tax=Myceligenerans pegani TaxID=2776917 RepID=A0ABR9MYG9_9MICO|nr:MFS transporter [Myceligenerans sp. TRM 65318]MBE1876440.1 MFS transporter [Myceligenerans sp. TRM 65318]MBE3018711.1 MFS transporter [Myceligenerans sp. TRM 65318]